MKEWVAHILGFAVILAAVPWVMELFFKYCDLVHGWVR